MQVTPGQTPSQTPTPEVGSPNRPSILELADSARQVSISDDTKSPTTKEKLTLKTFFGAIGKSMESARNFFTKLTEIKEIPEKHKEQYAKFKEAYEDFNAALKDLKTPQEIQAPKPQVTKEQQKRLDAFDAELEGISPPVSESKEVPEQKVNSDIIDTILRHAQKIDKSEGARYNRLENLKPGLLDFKSLDKAAKALQDQTKLLRNPENYTWSFTDRLRATPGEVKAEITAVVHKILRTDTRKAAEKEKSQFIQFLRDSGYTERSKEFITELANARLIDNPPDALKKAIDEAEDVLLKIRPNMNPKTVSTKELQQSYQILKEASTKIGTALREYQATLPAEEVKTAQKPQVAQVAAKPIRAVANPIKELEKELDTIKKEKVQLRQQMNEKTANIMHELGTKGMLELSEKDVRGLSSEEEHLLVDMANLLSREVHVLDDLRIQNLAQHGIKIIPTA